MFFSKTGANAVIASQNDYRGEGRYQSVRTGVHNEGFLNHADIKLGFKENGRYDET